jgi:YbbR domain-containing protein
VTSYYPTTYKAYFDVEDEKSIDVDLSYSTDDFIQDGYTMGQPLLSESTVTVKGPRSYVSQVASVVAAVNITDKLNSTTSMDLVPNAIDVNGNTVDYVTVETGGENLTITIPVLKEMELDVSVNFLGKPSKVNIDDWDITYSVNRVKAGVLEDANITSAVIGNIDFSSLSVGESSFTFDIGTLDGFVILDKIDEITVTVTVPSDYEESTVSVDSNSVKFINIPDGYKAEIISLDNSDVTVIGTEDNLNSITSANISLVVDLSKLDTDNIKVGTNTLDVTTTLSNSDTCWIYGDYSATIKIYKSTN